MTGPSSLWGAVAARYAEATELRAGDLAARFTVVFRGATIVITKSNGVERIVDFDEFRASWRVLAAGGSDEALRRTTGNGPYLRAIRQDLVASGVDPSDEAELAGPEDLNSGEVHLMAGVASASASTPDVLVTEGTPAGDQATELASLREALSVTRALLDQERAEKLDALRENSRLVASQEVLDERLSQESARASRLEVALQKETEKAPASHGAIGSQRDVSSSLLGAAESILKESSAPPDLRKATETAIELARRDPASAAAKARVVTEQIVRREWARVFGADASFTRKSFTDYARELEGSKGVNAALLSVKRTLYRVANPGAHELEMSPRRAALTVLILAAIVDAEASTL